ncbi:putative acyl-CoA dehydrogenase [Gordonia paraffinivorans NBRC 108238]|uniref:Acyl-CoA dehydrogenase n=1 Tax=Gordonia paraffinivorans NBRC 108238 TaxID=1223543 RepID=A0ABQ0IM88_9ACTN|nr:acyl-CoA dehydrogenase family protein [Gordonia paraffinivorans]GAC84668.1 putative acyl-CoA dehydrogenase [Gordonia paraffinivorans NBRC 108238]
MHWELSEEHEMFAASLREWLAAKYPLDTVRQLAESGDTSGFDDGLIAEGWWGVGYPEAAGGQGGGILELALAAREFGRAAATDSRWLAAALVAPLLTEAELAAQLSGEQRFALAVPADRVPGWRPLELADGQITGTVRHVLGAAGAGVYLVPVTGEAGDGIARIPAAAATTTADDLLDQTRQAANLSVEQAAATEVVPAGPAALEPVAALAAALTAADALGTAERMLELSVEYSKQRKQFGRFIGSFQAVQHACAQMLVTVEAGYSSALYAAAALDAGREDAATIAAVAKAQVTASAAQLADSALTVHGAIGYTWEHDLHLFYKRAKLDRPLYGTPKTWNERIATALLGAPAAS